MSATEKIRKEKWIDDKTRKIKEMTVKGKWTCTSGAFVRVRTPALLFLGLAVSGLEPEIQKLISKHKQDLKNLRLLHETELQQADERAAQRYVQQCQELRQQLEKEKEELRQREHELAKQRQANSLVCHCCSTLTGKGQKGKITLLNFMSELTFTTFRTKKGCVVRERPRRFNLSFFFGCTSWPVKAFLSIYCFHVY